MPMPTSPFMTFEEHRWDLAVRYARQASQRAKRRYTVFGYRHITGRYHWIGVPSDFVTEYRNEKGL